MNKAHLNILVHDMINLLYTDLLLWGNNHTQFVMQNIKMTFSVQPTHPLLK